MAETARSLDGEVAAGIREAEAGGRVRPRPGEWIVVGIAVTYAVLLLFAPLIAL